MWLEKYNLGPDCEPMDENTESAPPQSTEEPRDHSLEAYETYYKELFEVELYMTLTRTNGEQMPIGGPLNRA